MGKAERDMAEQTQSVWNELLDKLAAEEAQLLLGGGAKAVVRQHEKGRLTARERIDRLIDPGSYFCEFGLWAGWKMYDDYGGAPAAGVVCGVGTVAQRKHVIIANDATVKAGAFFPATAKKVLRAQKIAFLNRLPLIYLVDSAGVRNFGCGGRHLRDLPSNARRRDALSRATTTACSRRKDF